MHAAHCLLSPAVCQDILNLSVRFFGAIQTSTPSRNVTFRSAFVRTAERITIDALPPHKAILILYNNNDWEGELRLKPDWSRLGFDSPEGLQVENAVHRTGMRVEMVKNEKGEDVEKAVFFERPEECAKLENGELLFR